MRIWSFAKGQGTQNDFIVVKDRHGMLCPSPNDVRLLCDRRAGIGADGLLRVVKGGSVAEWDGDPDLWFMDYRNADGSIAEMCGNGLRVFVRYLQDENLINGSEVLIGTRAGLRRAEILPGGWVRVDMGPVTVGGQSQAVLAGASIDGTVVDVGNPHLVVAVDDVEAVRVADLSRGVTFDPQVFPGGANLEIATPVEQGRFAMRVLERGVGETRSCGTGTVAVAAAFSGAEPGTYRVETLGGCLDVEISDDRTATLAGPAVIVARGEVWLPDEANQADA